MIIWCNLVLLCAAITVAICGFWRHWWLMSCCYVQNRWLEGAGVEPAERRLSPPSILTLRRRIWLCHHVRRPDRGPREREPEPPGTGAGLSRRTCWLEVLEALYATSGLPITEASATHHTSPPQPPTLPSTLAALSLQLKDRWDNLCWSRTTLALWTDFDQQGSAKLVSNTHTDALSHTHTHTRSHTCAHMCAHTHRSVTATFAGVTAMLLVATLAACTRTCVCV